MARQRLSDPVEEQKAEPSELEQVGIETAISAKPAPAGGLKISDLTTISPKITRGVNPFDGYPVEKIKIGEDRGTAVQVAKHFIVFLSPDQVVTQDPAGMGRSRVLLDEKGNKTGMAKTDYETFHSRLVKDSTGSTSEVVFDRTMMIEDRPFYYAIIPDHVARAQILFKIKKGDKKATWSVDNRYKLLDSKQASRLSTVFRLFFAQQFAGEKAAEFHDTYKEE